MKIASLSLVASSLILSSCQTHTKDIVDIYEWPHIQHNLYRLKYQEERERLIKEKGYVDFGGSPLTWTEWADPGDLIDNKYESGFNDGWNFTHSSVIQLSSAGFEYLMKVDEINEMRKNKDKAECARGFIDALNEYKRIDNVSRKRVEEFISSFRASYLESYPYYHRPGHRPGRWFRCWSQ